MKKRLISIMLVAVMLLAMIPAMSVASFAADATSYRSIVTTDYIEVDGNMDDAYKNSEKISSTYWGKGDSATLGFEAYTAVTTRGLYIWAEIKDSSFDKSEADAADVGDKFQIYVRVSNGIDSLWGWYDTDYNGKALKHSINSQSDLEWTIASGCVFGSEVLADATYATMKLADGSGWRSETFIPFGDLDVLDIKGLKISVGFQANNEITGGTRYGLCYNHSKGGDYWYGYSDYTPLSLFAYDTVSAHENPVYVGNQAPTMDGSKDAVYSGSAITLKHVVTASGFENDKRDTLGTVSLVFDNEYIYMYYETVDNDLVNKATNGQSDADCVQIYYLFENNGSPQSGFFKTEVDPNGVAFYGSTGSTYGYPGTAYTSSDITVSRMAHGNNVYGVEIKMPIPDGEKAKLAAGQAVSFNFDVSAMDYKNATRRCYGGWDSNSSGRYIYNKYTVKENEVYVVKESTNYKTFPVLTLDKKLAYSAAPSIKSASLTLGSDITVNYYTTIGAGDVDNAYMRFTKSGKTSIAYPEKTSTAGEYKFRCTNIAPQTIGDNIKAELVIGDEVVATSDKYSVRQNCLNIYNNAKYSGSDYNNMKMLIKALLNYGAASQTYRDYKIGDPVDAEYDIDLSVPTAANNIKNVSTPISSSLKFTALGVRYDNTNKIFAKFIAPSLSGISVIINGYPVAINAVDGEENTYIVYSDAIPVTRFASEYRITLTNGTSSQTAVYSINSYAYAKLSSQNEAMVELAKATFTYGELAKKYVGHGPVSYKVMTFNDGDNSEKWNDKVVERAQIINDYKPDVVGMQEIRYAHANDYYFNGLPTYKTLLTDYTLVFYEKDTDNHDVPAMYYRTDKFDLVDSGIKWLSDTPDTKGSKFTESQYIRAFIWAKLKDKVTGETYMFVNTHLDFAAVSLKQTNRLLELVAPIAGDLPVIFTADWNFYRDSDSAKALNAAGYYSTESKTSNKYKPGTFPSSDQAIDFCFVKPTEFKTLDYKVINDHEYSLIASDHYAVISEIVPVKVYEQAELDKVIYGFFDGPDDIYGF